MNSLNSWENIVLVNIENNILWLSEEGREKINQTTSVFSDNCFNCLNWENLPWVDYGVLTQCEWLCSSRSLRKSSSTPACDNYDPQFPKN